MCILVFVLCYFLFKISFFWSLILAVLCAGIESDSRK